jgi:hypothetical protein
MPGTAISFDGHDLQTANIASQVIPHESGPDKTMEAFALAHANLSVIPFIDYPSKTIILAGEIVGSSITDLDSRIDSFKSYFNNAGANLDIGWAGSTRRYIATAKEPIINRDGGLAHANFTVVFMCTTPFGMDTSTTPIVNATGRTLSGYSDNFTVAASAPEQLPVITYTLTAFTGTNPLSVTFGNSANGQSLVINRTWTAGDVVVIDCGAKTVKINGVLFDASGAFPVFGSGAQTITYTDGFTTRTFNVNIVYTARYK